MPRSPSARSGQAADCPHPPPAFQPPTVQAPAILAGLPSESRSAYRSAVGSASQCPSARAYRLAAPRWSWSLRVRLRRAENSLPPAGSRPSSLQAISCALRGRAFRSLLRVGREATNYTCLNYTEVYISHKNALRHAAAPQSRCTTQTDSSSPVRRQEVSSCTVTCGRLDVGHALDAAIRRRAVLPAACRSPAQDPRPAAREMRRSNCMYAPMLAICLRGHPAPFDPPPKARRNRRSPCRSRRSASPRTENLQALSINSSTILRRVILADADRSPSPRRRWRCHARAHTAPPFASRSVRWSMRGYDDDSCA